MTRRRIAALVAEAATLAAGVPALRRAIRSPRGGPDFRRRTVELAVIWTVGAVAVRVATPAERRPFDVREQVLRPAAVGAGLVAAFAAGGVVGSRVPLLRKQIADVVDHARKGPLVPVAALALLTGAAEELFFRGASYDMARSVGLPAVAGTTALHILVTSATGNPMLVLASGPLSVLAGCERARTDSVVAPLVLHVIWSTGMLCVLPPILQRPR
ncbi:CPBP family glutamic-type intramembrane protease [Flexivirga sp. B27]